MITLEHHIILLTKIARNTTPAKKPKHPESEAVLAMGKIAPTIVVQNQFENVVREFALPLSRIGNISAHTTQTTGPQEYANPMTYNAHIQIMAMPISWLLSVPSGRFSSTADRTAVGIKAAHMMMPPVNKIRARPTEGQHEQKLRRIRDTIQSKAAIILTLLNRCHGDESSEEVDNIEA